MESGLQELKFSRYNQKVELSGKLFLYNACSGIRRFIKASRDR